MQILPRVDGNASDPYFVVEMRTGALSPITHLGDRLSHAHPLPLVDQNLGEVGIMSFDLLAMVQNYCAALAVDRLHNRVAGSMDRSSYGFGNIQSGVILRAKNLRVFLQCRASRNIHATAAQIEAMMTERDITIRFSTTIYVLVKNTCPKRFVSAHLSTQC